MANSFLRTRSVFQTVNLVDLLHVLRWNLEGVFDEFVQSLETQSVAPDAEPLLEGSRLRSIYEFNE